MYAGGQELALATDKDNCTGLHYVVCEYGASAEVIRLLLDAGRKELVVLANNTATETPLQWTCSHPTCNPEIA